MSDPLKHECGIAMIRLLKPLSYYQEKYGTPLYGFNQLFLLMEKQHNRGQDGAGIGCVKLGVEPGSPYMFRDRSIKSNPLARIFNGQLEEYNRLMAAGTLHPEFPATVKENFDFGGEILLGHLRYGTSGVYTSANCHPFVRQSNWPTKNLMLAGNFTITNEKEINNSLIERGQHPIFGTDTQAVLEAIGFHLDEAHDAIYHRMRDTMQGGQIPEVISADLDPVRILRKAAADWDGGYTIAGLIGNGDSFVMRDPRGIRPCFYFQNEEVIAFASERVALMTIFNQPIERVCELEPGTATVIKNDGRIYCEPFTEKQKLSPCSFERIYFSRGNDPEIYNERKTLGKLLVPQILKAINFDLKNTVFSYIPNSAEVSFLGMMQGMDEYLTKKQKEVIIDGKPSLDDIDNLLSFRPRVEKLVIKDAKLRTFIADDNSRDDLVANVYDTTYEVIRKGVDTLVVIDDSIVRGTTLEKSILKMLDKLEPKKIVVVSSAPQIRYPDCYGIDMSKIKEFVAFRAMQALLKDNFLENKMEEAYHNVLANIDNDEQSNYVQDLYNQFTDEQLSAKITEIVRPDDLKADLEVIYQTVDNLHKACPKNLGDWYFTGDYPTKGGMRVVNKAFMNFMEGKEVRAY